MNSAAGQLWQIIRSIEEETGLRACGEHPLVAARRWRFDWAYPCKLVAIELDGGRRQAEGGRHASDVDYEKINAAAITGWTVLRFTPTMVLQAPSYCLAAILAALGAGPVEAVLGERRFVQARTQAAKRRQAITARRASYTRSEEW